MMKCTVSVAAVIFGVKAETPARSGSFSATISATCSGLRFSASASSISTLKPLSLTTDATRPIPSGGAMQESLPTWP